jgi:trimethylamine--corrinoid protein Co-methyltransferase
MGTSLPFYKPLTSKNVRQIDDTAHQILEEIGIRVCDDVFLDRLKAAGAIVDYSNERACFPADWLAEVLSRAPSRFTLHSRDGQNDLHLGDGKVYFTNGGRVFRIFDIETGDYRLTKLRDVAQTAKLVDHLKHLDSYIIACQAHDLAAKNYHLNDFYHAFNCTTKHVMGGCDNLKGVRQVWELACFIAGGDDQFKEKPFVSVITNQISPLTVGSNTLKILNFCVKHGIPVTCAPAPIAGATSPATLAGSLAQMHAEALAGVAIAQILFPGAKVFYGVVPTVIDLRSMELAMGSVEMGMMNAAAVQLARLYQLPVYASAGVSEAKSPDIQAGCEKSLNILLVGMAGADYIHLAAGMLDSGNTISYEQYIIDDEIIGMIKRILSGVRVNKETLGFDVIKKVGPGGNYVIEAHTIEHMMDEFFYPNPSVRLNFDIWQEAGQPDMLRRATIQVRQILQDEKGDLLARELIHNAFPEIQNVF